MVRQKKSACRFMHGPHLSPAVEKWTRPQPGTGQKRLVGSCVTCMIVAFSLRASAPDWRVSPERTPAHFARAGFAGVTWCSWWPAPARSVRPW